MTQTINSENNNLNSSEMQTDGKVASFCINIRTRALGWRWEPPKRCTQAEPNLSQLGYPALTKELKSLPLWLQLKCKEEKFRHGKTQERWIMCYDDARGVAGAKNGAWCWRTLKSRLQVHSCLVQWPVAWLVILGTSQTSCPESRRLTPAFKVTANLPLYSSEQVPCGEPA